MIEQDGQQTYALIFESGDEVTRELLRFANEKNITAAHFTAIGAFQNLTLGYFNWEKKEYKKIPVPEQVEVLSLAGDITASDQGPKLHAHVVVGKSDGSAHGGHLMEAHVRPTLELILMNTPASLHREMDPDSGIPLIKI